MLLTHTRCPSLRGFGKVQPRVRPGALAATRATSNKFTLTPTGDGDTRHIGNEIVPALKPFSLGSKGVIEVGRARPAEVLIPAPTVSSRHAIMRIEDDALFVTDLGSTNGTSVNGVDLAPMTAAQLKADDEVIFGDSHLAKFKVSVEVVADVYTAPLPEDMPQAAVEVAEPVVEAEPEPAKP